MKRFLIWLVALTVCLVLRAPAAISVGPNGTGVWTFDTPPAMTEWATVNLPGGSSDIISDAQLDVAVQPLSAALFTNTLSLTATTNPAPLSSLLARYNTSGRYLQMRPGGVAATVLMATLQNDTGRDQSELTVSYDFRVANPPWVTIAEEVPGLRAYFSLAGSPGSWQLIPELTYGAPGPVWARLQLGYWPAGAQLFLLWADDNSFANANNPDLQEDAYVIDDFNAYVDNIIFDPISGVAIYRPISGESFPEGASIVFSMYSTPGLGVVTNVVLYDGTNVVGRSDPPPLLYPVTILYTNAATGLHQFTAVGMNAGLTVTSAPVSITVTAYRPPLTIAVDAVGLAVISWPEPSTGFELQSASDLRVPVWEKVTEPDESYDGFHHVFVDISTGTRFFRLEKR
jgi:hypothetical protein